MKKHLNGVSDFREEYVRYTTRTRVSILACFRTSRRSTGHATSGRSTLLMATLRSCPIGATNVRACRVCERGPAHKGTGATAGVLRAVREARQETRVARPLKAIARARRALQSGALDDRDDAAHVTDETLFLEIARHHADCAWYRGLGRRSLRNFAGAFLLHPPCASCAGPRGTLAYGIEARPHLLRRRRRGAAGS